MPDKEWIDSITEEVLESENGYSLLFCVNHGVSFYSVSGNGVWIALGASDIFDVSSRAKRRINLHDAFNIQKRRFLEYAKA